MVKTKLLCCLLVLAALLLWTGISPARALEPGAESPAVPFSNSDREAFVSDVLFEIGTGTERGILRTTFTPGVSTDQAERQLLTDAPADQLLALGDALYAVQDCCLYAVDPASGQLSLCCQTEAPILRFAKSGDDLYLLTGGSVLRLEADGSCHTVLAGPDIRRFWLSDADHLCWMTESDVVHTRCLSDGTETTAQNRILDLDTTLAAAGGKRGLSLTSLRQKFPAGKYWNHMPNLGTGPSYNNQDGWTDIPCPAHNNYCGTARQSCNGFAPNGREYSWQCMGYAEKCAYDVTGVNPRDTQSGWVTKYASSALEELKPGDIIRYRGDRHSIYILGLNGDTVFYTDCNSDGHCLIRWDQTISLSTIRSSFNYLMTLPDTEASFGRRFALEVKGEVNGQARDDLSGAAVFDVYVENQLYQADCRSFRAEFAYGTVFVIKNIRAQGGLSYGGADGALSGYLTRDNSVVLKLGDCVLDLDGCVNGSSTEGLSGSADVYVNGRLVASGCSDFIGAYPKGTLFEFRNVRPNGGYEYLGCRKGSIAGALARSTVTELGFGKTGTAQFDPGEGGSVDPGQKAVICGELYGPLPTPVNQGQAFLGWYTDAAAGQAVIQTSTVRTSGSQTLYAHWGPICDGSHAYSAAAQAPSCTLGGWTVQICSRCGNHRQQNLTDPLGHSWGSPTYLWSTDRMAVLACRTCQRDQTHMEAESVRVSGPVIRPSTDTAGGTMTYTASFRNKIFQAQSRTVPLPKLTELPCGGSAACPGAVFDDMPSRNSWAHDPIDWALARGITSGTGLTSFSPDHGCTRAQVVTFLWRTAGSPEPKNGAASLPFTDVPAGAYYRKAVAWAVEQGITAGTTKTAFSPEAVCTRAQIVTFLWRTAGSPEVEFSDIHEGDAEPHRALVFPDTFTDVRETAYYAVAVRWAVTEDVTQGVGNKRFAPEKTCTRAQIVTFLYRSEQPDA